jgi:hypothetical protein
MNDKIKEALGILQEECAEVIVEVSKCNRFGIDSLHYKTGLTHNTMLEMEVGDVLALIHVLIEQGVLDQHKLEIAKQNKIEKLKVWSTIFKTL